MASMWTQMTSSLTIAVILAVQICQGKVYMNVSPYPARVYENAPPGVPVLTVNAYDNSTGEAVTNFRLEKRGLSEYFSITQSGLLQTAKTIDRNIGFRFQFFVFAVNTIASSVEWKHVIVEVSKENLYPPTFSESTYSWSVYRFAPVGHVIGTVSASDADDDPHNKHFTIFAPPRQPSVEYVSVTSSGDVILAKTPADGMETLRVLVLAVDDGSPQMTATTTAVIIVDDVTRPDTFCLSTTMQDTRLCWKNPMPGREDQGYVVLVQGQNLVIHKRVEGDPDVEEFCISTSQMQLGENYTFRVTLATDETAGVELTFQKLGQGFSMDCLDKNFAACNFLQPCENGASCVMAEGGGLNYTCLCPPGWQGQNCTQVDLCTTIPCQNNGVCIFQGHQQHTCDCQPGYFGKLCQHFNVCDTVEPCQNGGICRMHENGTYSCECPDYFTGNDCSLPDPCSPSPCGEGGECIKFSDTEVNCSCYRGYYGDRCDEIDLCQSNPPCQNGGTCVSTGNSTFRCACPPEFTGPFCDVFNACLVACKNNASCDMTNDGYYNCTCLPAFYGQECQYFNRCHDNPCINGTCNADESSPLCDCDPGFFGPKCEAYNPCLTDPCESHGDCVLLSAADHEDDDLPYECQCYDTWWGLHCQFANICKIGVCQNGATCQNTPPNTFSCRCPPGYYESDCSKYNPCDVIGEGQELCQNGGTCHNTSTSSFWCDCVNGYYGSLCEHRDPCFSSPCLNSATCSNLTDTLYNCTCAPGYLGQHCEQENPCAGLVQPCSNGGSCVTSGGSSRCACSEGFVGYFCQIPDPCYDGHLGGNASSCNGGRCVSVNRTLVDGLKDEVEDADFLFRCQCRNGYTGKRCEVPLSNCSDVRCLNNGDCLYGACVCPPGFTGERCEEPVCDPDLCGEGLRCQVTGQATTCVCQNGWAPPDCRPACLHEDTRMGKTGQISWPYTLVGDTALVTCPYGGLAGNASFATRPCVRVGQDEAQWGQPEDGNCNELGLAEASRRLNALNDLTSNPTSLGTSEVHNYTTILEELFVYTLMDQDVASVMMNIISNLGDVNVSVTVESNRENNTSERLVKMLDDYTAEVNVTEGENVTLTSPNFQVVAVSVDNTKSTFTYVPSVAADNSTTKMDVSITIPPEALVQDPQDVTSDRKQTRLQMIGYRKSQFFIPNGTAFSESFIEHQPVISASVTGRKIVSLTSPVVYQIRNLQPNSNYTCVFWDPQNRTWSTRGVVTTIKSGNSTECRSFHLTSFAVLLDPSPHFALSSVHETVLTYISYIGSAVSLFCLTLTIATYALFRSLNKDKSGKILLNLCVALLLLNVVFLANGLSSSGDDNGDLDDKKGACTAVAVLLHYLLLASLAWMLVEAVEMYRALVTVFAKYAQCYMLKRCLIGWGVPIVIVAITLGVDRGNYESDGAFCFISRSNPAAYYGSLVAPACVVLVINTIIFVMVTRVILKPRFQQQKQKESEGITPAQVRGAFTVMFLLGVTWVFGPLAIKEAKVVFNYLFCILNSLQGFLIFVFRCLFNPEVRMCWLQLIKMGTLKKRRGPIRSNVYSDSSSRADGKSGTYPNGSHGGGGGFVGSNGSSTIKSNLMHSNSWHPKLNGFAGGQALERRGTKFSTLDFYQSTPESAKKGQQNVITEDERYGDGNLHIDGLTSDDPSVLPALDFYETGNERPPRVQSTNSKTYDEFYGDGGVMEYYESIRTSRKENSSSHVTESQRVSEKVEEHRQSSSSSRSENRSSWPKNDKDELTYL